MKRPKKRLIAVLAIALLVGTASALTFAPIYVVESQHSIPSSEMNITETEFSEINTTIGSLVQAFIYEVEDFDLKVTVPSYVNASTPDDKDPARLNIYLKKKETLSGFFEIAVEGGIRISWPSLNIRLFVDIDLTLPWMWKPDLFQFEWPISGIPMEAISLESGDIGVYASVVPIKAAEGELQNLTMGEWSHIGSYDLYVVEEQNVVLMSLPAENITIGNVTSLEWTITPVYVSYGNWSLVWEYKADHEIKKVSVSSDGNYIAAVGDNWNSEEFRNDVLYLLTGNGELLWKKDSRSLLGFSDWIHDVSVSRNATYIAVGSEGETYLLQRNGSIIWKKEHVEGMNRVSISDDGEYIAIGTYLIGIGWVHFLDKNGQELWNFSTVGSVESISTSKNGQYVAVGDYKGYAYLLDREGNLLWDKKMGEWCDIYVSISADGEFVGIGTSDREIAILNKNGDWLLNPTLVQHTVVGVSITSDGNLLFIPAESEGLRIYNVEGELINSFEAREKVLDVDNTPEGVYVVIGSDDLRVYLFENPVIPEFSSTVILLLTIVFVTFAVIIRKKRLPAPK